MSETSRARQQVLGGIPRQSALDPQADPQADPQSDPQAGPAVAPPAVREGAPARAFAAFTGRVLGPYQAAVVRIGFGLAWLAFLLREWPERRVLYGDRSPWSADLAGQLLAENG